jgi:hypothetical protein
VSSPGVPSRVATADADGTTSHHTRRAVLGSTYMQLSPVHACRITATFCAASLQLSALSPLPTSTTAQRSPRSSLVTRAASRPVAVRSHLRVVPLPHPTQAAARARARTRVCPRPAAAFCAPPTRAAHLMTTRPRVVVHVVAHVVARARASLHVSSPRRPSVASPRQPTGGARRDGRCSSLCRARGWPCW